MSRAVWCNQAQSRAEDRSRIVIFVRLETGRTLAGAELDVAAKTDAWTGLGICSCHRLALTP